MNLVAIDNTKNTVLESQVFTHNRAHIQNMIIEDLTSSGLTQDMYSFQEMTNEQLQQYIQNH